MCTAVSINENGHFFGRTLDIECSLVQKIVIMPRNFKLNYLYEGGQENHFAMIGVAHVSNCYPLYFDAVNEHGLCIAGLSFTGNAVYHMKHKSNYNVASFELIPWILGQCESLKDAAELLRKTNITPDSFSEKLSATPLHWIVSDKGGSITVESTKDGLKIYDNPVGILTNNPDFNFHIANISQYVNLTPTVPQNRLAPILPLKQFSKGFGSLGLPGDFSSASRFVRATFFKYHTTGYQNEVCRLLRILDLVSVPYGCVINNDHTPHYTVYSSCIDTGSLVYYYSTFGCRRTCAVDLKNADLNSRELSSFEMVEHDDIKMQ